MIIFGLGILIMTKLSSTLAKNVSNVNFTN